MTLSSTGKAVKAVADLLARSLKDTLHNEGIEINVNVGRPEPPTSSTSPTLMLFLYESQLDPNLKNVPLEEGQKPPLWLVLKFLLTAFDKGNESDTLEALECLGEGMRVLQGLNFLSPLPTDTSLQKAPLEDNPESLKITFNEISYELLSKIMQGSTEKYRYSIGFEIRPVMIATGDLPSYSLLVGVDYTNNAAIRKDAGIEIDVFSSIGPSITSLSPLKFEANHDSILSITGDNLNLPDLTVQLGSVKLPIISQRVNKIECRVDGNISGGKIISAGSQPITVTQTLPNKRRRSSNVLIGNLLPTLDKVSYSLNLFNPDNILCNLKLFGTLLGTSQDDVFVGLYQEGKTIKLLDNFTDLSIPQGTQTEIEFSFSLSDIKNGAYRVILVVNGQQAKNSPEVNI